MSIDKINNNNIVNPVQSYKFRLHPILESQRKIPIVKVPLRFRVTPDSLVELSGNIIRNLPFPQVFYWTNLDVIKWIHTLGFPEYIKCFHKNFINGYSLIFIDASALVSMNIKNFQHIQKITESIRKLYGIEMIRYVKDLSSLMKHPYTYFKLYHANSGLKYQSTNAIELFRKMKILRPGPSYYEHWTVLENWLQHRQRIELELVGRKKSKLYKIDNNFRELSGKIDLEDKNPLCICHIPPCTCKNSKFTNIHPNNIVLKNLCINDNHLSNQRNILRTERIQRISKMIDKSENLNCIFIRGTCIWKSKSCDPESSIPILSKESMRNYSASLSDLPAIKIDITKSSAMKIKIK